MKCHVFPEFRLIGINLVTFRTGVFTVDGVPVSGELITPVIEQYNINTCVTQILNTRDMPCTCGGLIHHILYMHVH